MSFEDFSNLGNKKNSEGTKLGASVECVKLSPAVHLMSECLLEPQPWSFNSASCSAKAADDGPSTWVSMRDQGGLPGLVPV